jgi:hypothetical protein
MGLTLRGLEHRMLFDARTIRVHRMREPGSIPQINFAARYNSVGP